MLVFAIYISPNIEFHDEAMTAWAFSGRERFQCLWCQVSMQVAMAMAQPAPQKSMW